MPDPPHLGETIDWYITVINFIILFIYLFIHSFIYIFIYLFTYSFLSLPAL